MFSKGSRDDDGAPPSRMQRAGRAAPSIISADVVVIGNVTSGGDVQIDGTIEGDVKSQSLTVGDKATINGEILADDVIVRGRVIGSIRARRVQLCSTSHVEGNILHEALAVETGAYFEGNCRHSPDPLSDDIKAVRTESGNGALMSAGEARKGTGSKRSGGILGSFGGSSQSNSEAGEGKAPQGLTLGDRRPG
jgi:cytoskeletal protein CcmA (bactofilin family)